VGRNEGTEDVALRGACHMGGKHGREVGCGRANYEGGSWWRGQEGQQMGEGGKEGSEARGAVSGQRSGRRMSRGRVIKGEGPDG
jgi:hypothetical protein